MTNEESSEAIYIPSNLCQSLMIEVVMRITEDKFFHTKCCFTISVLMTIIKSLQWKYFIITDSVICTSLPAPSKPHCHS